MEGFDNLRRGLEIKMHGVVNDAARDVVDRINRVEPKMRAKASQTKSTETTAQVVVTGSTEATKSERSAIDEAIRNMIFK